MESEPVEKRFYSRRLKALVGSKPAQSRNRIPPRLWFPKSPNAFEFQASSADEARIFLALKMILWPGLFLSLELEI